MTYWKDENKHKKLPWLAPFKKKKLWIVTNPQRPFRRQNWSLWSNNDLYSSNITTGLCGFAAVWLSTLVVLFLVSPPPPPQLFLFHFWPFLLLLRQGQFLMENCNSEMLSLFRSVLLYYCAGDRSEIALKTVLLDGRRLGQVVMGGDPFLGGRGFECILEGQFFPLVFYLKSCFDVC